MHMHTAQCPLCYKWKRCVVSCSRKGELFPEMDLCSLMSASPNAKVHGVLTMLSQMKPSVRLYLRENGHPGWPFSGLLIFT